MVAGSLQPGLLFRRCLEGKVPGVTENDALMWLERAASRPGTEQLTKEWVSCDPDLDSIRRHPRFDRVVSSLREGGKKP